MEPENPLLDDYVLGLTGKSRPRICFLPTASRDNRGYIARFYQAFTLKAETSHWSSFPAGDVPPESLLKQDVLYVGGGSTQRLLTVWRARGLSAIVRSAWEAGIILCGPSAGAMCWFEAGLTDSLGPELAPLKNGLGFLPGSFCPHYDSEPMRRPAYLGAVAAGLLSGFGVDDGAALHFEGTTLARVVTSRPEAKAVRVVGQADGEVCESLLPSRYLGAVPG